MDGREGERLVDRRPDAILFRMAGQDITARRFAADAQGIAQRLPDAAYVINLCQDRYRFAVLFAACVIAGRICLLTGDQSERALAHLRARFGRSQTIDDTMVAALGHAADRADSWPPAEIPLSQCCAIVLTSGSASGLDTLHRRDDAYRVLTKPFRAAELLALLSLPASGSADAADG